MKKASEQLQALLDLGIPEAKAEEITKSQIEAGDLEDDLAKSATIDKELFNKLMLEIKKGLEPAQDIEKSEIKVAEDVTGIATQLATLVSKSDVNTKALADGIVAVGQMCEALAKSQAKLDERVNSLIESHGELVKSTTKVVPPRSVIATEATEETNNVQLRKSLRDKLVAIADDVSVPRDERAKASQALTRIFTDDPQALAKSVGISL
jgi:hypothetical protein